MVGHLLKVAVSEKLSPEEKEKHINALWLQAEGLLNEARKELEAALPYLRQRREHPDPAYLAVTKAKGLLSELEGT